MKIIFKHSHKCPISRRAKDEMEAFLENSAKKFEYEFIDVFQHRERSNEIAKIYNIEHESPQILLIDDNNNVVWEASHHAITEDSIEEALS